MRPIDDTPWKNLLNFIEELDLPSKQKSPESVTAIEPTNKHESLQTEESSEESCVQGSKSECDTKESALTLRLSATLIRKLGEKAQIEGVSIQDFASELLSEGLVLRAWEIVEKKNAMRGVNASGPSPSQGNNHRNQKFGYRNNQNGYVKRMPNDSGSSPRSNSSRQSYKNIMEDNANFLEYVRNQEKNRDKY